MGMDVLWIKVTQVLLTLEYTRKWSLLAQVRSYTGLEYCPKVSIPDIVTHGHQALNLRLLNNAFHDSEQLSF